MRLPLQRMAQALRISCTMILKQEKYLDAYQTAILEIHKNPIRFPKYGPQKL